MTITDVLRSRVKQIDGMLFSLRVDGKKETPLYSGLLVEQDKLRLLLKDESIKRNEKEKNKCMEHAIAFNTWVENNVHNRLKDGKYIISVGGKFKTVTAKHLYKMFVGNGK